MFEIELKAHVYNKEKLKEKLKLFATYEQSVERNDFYYEQKDKNISVRLRQESTSLQNSKSKEKIQTKNIFTYKKKETKLSSQGIKTEVNDEKECTVSDFVPIEEFLKDAGFVQVLHKQKIVEDYTCKTKFGKANIELCNVPPLGDFIEIEILNESKDKKNIENIQQELFAILEKCSIPKSNIEQKYYSKMLQEANFSGVK